MSKQYEKKKEAFSQLNRQFQTDTAGLGPVPAAELAKRYQVLLKRTKQLEKVYEFHKNIVQNISSGLITINFDGNITFINTAALQTVGYTFKDLVNKPVNLLFADSSEAETILHEVTVSRNMYESQEINLISRRGNIIPIGFSTTLLKNGEHDQEGVIFSFRDLTQIRSFKMQMERMDRLATLGEVSAGIAHEIRNPLAGIKTSAQVLEESFAPGDFRAELIGRIVKEIDRANELLKRFFKFARPGRPKQEFINLHLLLDGIILLLKSRLRKNNIKLTTQYADELPHIYVDENQLEQVIINLILNAIDAIENGGEITIRTHLETGRKQKKDGMPADMVCLTIVDTGCGIKKENLEKIFNPFFTTKSHGVGLGLSISSRLLEENECQVQVESEEGIGSTFNIYVPTG